MTQTRPAKARQLEAEADCFTIKPEAVTAVLRGPKSDEDDTECAVTAFALMDSDGDGLISLQEFQTANERIFRAIDTNKDGTLTLSEMQDFAEAFRVVRERKNNIAICERSKRLAR
jgi:Ca2+-binding EF-hand superfamily protein